MKILGLEPATKILDAALSEGRRLGLAPLTAAVLDAGGNLIVFEREDGAGILRFDIAFAKAWGSLGMGFSSREVTERAAKAPAFYSALSMVAGGRIAPSPGGILITNEAGTIVGAVGVSDGTEITTKNALSQASRQWDGRLFDQSRNYSIDVAARASGIALFGIRARDADKPDADSANLRSRHRFGQFDFNGDHAF